MFTGLIQGIGRLAALERAGEAGRIAIRHAPWESPLAIGESVAVQGACLTVVRADATEFACDVLAETLNRTSLADRRPGDLLNLERALRPTDRLGGHFVTGHIDGVGRVAAIEPRAGDRVMEIECDPGLFAGLVSKGSVAVDGISLTLVKVAPPRFTVHVIDHTWQATSLSVRRAGDRVNIETDLLAKFVQAHLDRRQEGGFSEEALHRAGF